MRRLKIYKKTQNVDKAPCTNGKFLAVRKCITCKYIAGWNGSNVWCLMDDWQEKKGVEFAMREIKVLILLVITLWFVGCTSSVHELCTNTTIIVNNTIETVREVTIEHNITQIEYINRTVFDETCNKKLTVCYVQTDYYKDQMNNCLAENLTIYADNVSQAYADCERDLIHYRDIVNNITDLIHG